MTADRQTPILPGSMVERATSALREHHVSVWAALPNVLNYLDPHRWACVCGEGAIKARLTEAEAESRTHVAAAVVAAVLEGCEVRIEEGVRLHWPAGFPTVEVQWDGPFEPGRARRTVDGRRHGEFEPGSRIRLHRTVIATLLHRTVITTAPEISDAC